MKNTLVSAMLTFVCGLFLSANVMAREVKINNLKTEYAEAPIGIDIEKPRFSWQMQADVNGCYQKAYQVRVTDERGTEVWNSGKKTSGNSLNIRYEGVALQPTTLYTWEVTVWDDKNSQHTASSWFETGLMQAKTSNGNPAGNAWSHAKWIGGGDDDLALYAQYLPIFRIQYGVQLDAASKSTRVGFVFGANDQRLMDKNKNLYFLENKKNESYLLVELDISPLVSNEAANLHIYRVGYHPDDRKDVPFKTFPIPAALLNNQNKYDKIKVEIVSIYGNAQIFVGGSESANKVAELGLNPVGGSSDFITFPVLGDIGLALLPHQKAAFSEIEIRNVRKPSNLLYSRTGGKNESSDIATSFDGGTNGFFSTFDPSRNAMPMLRTTFASRMSDLKKARLYVTSRGIYEFYINGKRVGDDYFNPGFTQYNKTHLYQTFDVTEMLRPGENAMGALLAEGWWSGGATYGGDRWNFFGDRQSLMAKLVVTDANGKEEVFVTNPDTWQYFNDGPIVYGSFFQGEVYDASKEKQVEGWSTVGYQASAWKKAQEIPLKGHVFYDETQYAGMELTGRYDQAVKEINELTAISFEEVRPGVFIYDMGQNMVGVPKIHLRGMKPGQQINLRFAEVKYPDLPEYKAHTGLMMLENIRGAMAQDIYLAKGGDETIHPRFTYHGYRFIEITGIEKPLPLADVKGTVISSIHQLASSYTTSNPKVNKLWENITWSTFGNFVSIPTDCPQRNERMGWSGDISVFARTATYLADVSQFLRRHMRAMRDMQRADGRFPDATPMDAGFGGLLWGSAGLTVPWETYQQYQDADVLAEHYDAMQKYMRYVQEKTIDPETGLIVQDRSWGDLADWLSPEYARGDKSLLWEAYYIFDLEIMYKVATILGKKEDAERYKALYAERKAFFTKTYIQPETGKTRFSAFDTQQEGKIVDTQTSYVLPLVFDIATESDKPKLQAHLLETVARENKADNGVVCPPYTLMTGFIGTTWISKALSDNGQTDAAYRLLQQTAYPSWLYSVEQGATTIWERLNSYTHTHGFGGNNSMNSFNHYSFGAVGMWMCNHSLGIERNETIPGFKHFLLKPEPDPTGEMTFAKGYYDSMYGRIESAWEKIDEGYRYTFSIPANTVATLRLKASSPDHVRCGKKPLKSQPGVTYTGENDGKQQFELPSGRYEIIVK